MQLNTKKGFTLIELIVVIGIMGVLYTIVFGSISNSKARSRDDKRISDVKEIQLALTQFFDACSQYPSGIATNASCPTNPLITISSYIAQLPTDPSTGDSYHYRSPAPGLSTRSFCLGATLDVIDASARPDNAGCDTDCTGGALCYSVKGP